MTFSITAAYPDIGVVRGAAATGSYCVGGGMMRAARVSGGDRRGLLRSAVLVQFPDRAAPRSTGKHNGHDCVGALTGVHGKRTGGDDADRTRQVPTRTDRACILDR